ncbi:MAG: DASS family sodium-coupled anion symporter, partial [Acetobacterales bacterium]
MAEGETPDIAPDPHAVAALRRRGRRHMLEILAGIAAFAVLIALPPPGGMGEAAWRVVAVTALMAVWWVSEAVPAAITALVPIALFPLLGVRPVGEVTAPYANPLVFLLFGGFLLGLAMEHCALHRRIALAILRAAGRRPEALVGGFMAATAFLSMWISNTATTAMMLPIGLSVVALIGTREAGAPLALPESGPERNLAVALLLGIAYAANIGGMATLIGTPPNALLAGYMEETHGIRIGFAQWMLVGVPAALLMLGLAWLLLTRLIHPVAGSDMAGLRSLLGRETVRMGPVTRAEWRVAAICIAAALGWLLRPLLEALLPGLALSDAGIAMLAGLALFVVPADMARDRFLLDWTTARAAPWNVVLLVGGGLSLGGAIDSSGLSAWIGEALSGLGAAPLVVAVAALAGAAMLVSHITSNTATAAARVPIVAGLAATVGEAPLQ